MKTVQQKVAKSAKVFLPVIKRRDVPTPWRELKRIGFVRLKGGGWFLHG